MAVLRRLMEEVPLKDGESWLAAALAADPALALRLMEVRSAYCDDFDWGTLRVRPRQMNHR